MIQFFFLTVLSLSVTGSLLFLFVLAFSPLLSRGFSPQGNRRIYCSLLLFFAIPFGKIIRPLLSLFTQKRNLTVSFEETSSPSISSEVLQITPTPTTTSTSSFEYIPLLLGIVWILGVIVILLYWGLIFLRLRKHLKILAKPITDSHTLLLYKNSCAQMENTVTIPLYEVVRLDTPMIIRLFRPMILLPKSDWSDEELTCIFLHELSHYKRKDLWIKTFGALLCAIHWFNPLLWYLMRKINAWMEKAADATAVKEMNFAHRKIYAETILKVLIQSNAWDSYRFTTAFCSQKNSIKERMRTLMSPKKPSPKLLALSVAALGVLTASGFILSTTAYEPAAPLPTSSSPVIDAENQTSTSPLPSQTVSSATSSETSSSSDEVLSVVPSESESAAVFLEEVSHPEMENILIPDAEKIDFLWPTTSQEISCSFAEYPGHTGMDISGTNWDDIYAATSGQVILVKYDQTGYGYHILIDHGNGYKTLYANCSELLVKVGDMVETGQLVAKLGHTGNATGDHLHFEIRKDSIAVDPEQFF